MPQLWGSPLYHELCVGLRALARPWLVARSLRTETAPHAGGGARAPVGRPKQPQGRHVWRLIEPHRPDGGPIEATSLDDLRRAVRERRRIDSDESLQSVAVSLAGNIE